MKGIFESVIKRGGYDLTEILKKIDGYHIEGKLTDGERDELYALARGYASAEYDLKTEVEHLWAGLREARQMLASLRSAVEALGGSADDGGDASPSEAVDFVQPTGAHDAYQAGDRVIFGGVVYVSLIDNNVWAPDVYPAGWEVAT